MLIKTYAIILFHNDKEIYRETMLYHSVSGAKHRANFVLANIREILKGDFFVTIRYETKSGKYMKQIIIKEPNIKSILNLKHDSFLSNTTSQ